MNPGSAGHPAPHDHQPLSQILRALLAGASERIKVGDVVDAFGRRAFGALLFAFALINLIPAPPGSSAVLAIPLLIIAPQLIIGVANLWLPKALDRRSLTRADLGKLLDRVLPALERVEKLLAPRLGFMFGPIGDRVLGLVCVVLALALALPIPLFNMAPAFAIATLSLGLTARDGLVVLIGYGVAAVCGVALFLSAHAVVGAVQRMIHFFGA